MATGYKIKNKNGKFSTGGKDPDYTRYGKIWR